MQNLVPRQEQDQRSRSQALGQALRRDFLVWPSFRAAPCGGSLELVGIGHGLAAGGFRIIIVAASNADR